MAIVRMAGQIIKTVGRKPVAQKELRKVRDGVTCYSVIWKWLPWLPEWKLIAEPNKGEVQTKSGGSPERNSRPHRASTTRLEFLDAKNTAERHDCHSRQQ